MSGYKRATIKISEADYRRLHEADMQGRFSHVAHREAQQANRDSEALQAMRLMFEDRQNEFRETMAAFGNEIGQIENETTQILMDQQDVFDQQMNEHLASLQEDTAGALQALSQVISEQIETDRHRHGQQMAGMERRLEALSEDSAQKTGLARQWLDSAAALRNFIETHYDHERFFSGQFERLDLQLQQADENYLNGMPEAALLGAQQVYQECSQKRLELERLTSEWQILYQDASKLLDGLIRFISAGKFIPALDTQGRELSIEINLDQWSDYHYTSLARHARNLRSYLRSEAEHLTSAELAKLIRNTIPALKAEFEKMVFEARLAVIYSQIRINIADIAIQALEKQGFAVNGHGYTGDNMRMPYSITLQNIEGSQVIIHVNPIPNAASANDLVIESHDSEVRTESELRSRSQEILRSLNQYGLRVGPLSTDRQLPAIPAVIDQGREMVASRSTLQLEDQHD